MTFPATEKEKIHFLIGYLEALASFSKDETAFEALQCPIAMLKDLVGYKE